MIYIVRNADETIKTFSETDNWVLEDGEKIEVVDSTFSEYANRLRLSSGGISGQTIQVAKNSGDMTVIVSCPGKSSVDLSVNGVKETVSLSGGKGTITLSSAVSGLFLIEPFDKTQYCAAGEAVLAMEVQE